MKYRIKNTAHVSNIDGQKFVDNVHSQILTMQEAGLEVEVLHGVCNAGFSAIILGREVNS